MLSFKSDTLGEVWLNSLYQVMKNGYVIKDKDVKLYDLGNMANESFMHKIRLHSSYNPASSTLNSINLKEVRNLYYTISSINENDEIIQKFADKDRIVYTKERYGPTTSNGYGSRIYGSDGINQFKWLLDHLNNKPETKSATISIHRPGEKPACVSLIDFKYRNSKLDMNIVYRSQNIFLKQPGNLIALGILQRNLAEELGVHVGSVDILIMSAHVYEINYDEATHILKENSLWE